MEKIQITLTHDEACILAMFCKRSFIERVEPFAEHKTEALKMLDGIRALRFQLRDHGYDPR